MAETVNLPTYKPESGTTVGAFSGWRNLKARLPKQCGMPAVTAQLHLVTAQFITSERGIAEEDRVCATCTSLLLPHRALSDL
eukprot:600997-Rhodomonas_salina.6